MIVVVLVVAVVAPVVVAIFWSVGGEEVHVAALDVDIVRMDTHVILRKRLYGPIVYSRGQVISRFSSAYHTPKTLKNAQIRIC